MSIVKYITFLSVAPVLPALMLACMTQTVSAATAGRYGAVPLAFEANRGQSDSDARYLVRRGKYQMFFRDHEAVLAVKAAPGNSSAPEVETLRFRWLHSGSTSLVGEAKTGGTSNYLIGNDPSKWKREIPQYGRVRYQNLYPGIDLIYYGKDGELEYDLLVAPGADPSVARLKVLGAQRLEIRDGDLILHTAHGEVVHRRPVVYQQLAGRRRLVDSRYRMVGTDEVAFELGRYDRSKQLVIDPVVTFSVIYGGGSVDQAEAVALDAGSNIYVTGYTTSNDLTQVSGIGRTRAGGASDADAFVLKLNPAGSSILYSTYIGGLGNDRAHAIAVDASGLAHITGETTSSDFPQFSPLNRSLQNVDAFVTRLSASGSSITLSGLLGGSLADIGNAIAIESTGSNIYIAGSTTSLTLVNNPGDNRSGARDVFLARVSGSGSGTREYQRFYGGSQLETAYAVTLREGFLYVAGETTSTNLVGTSAQASNGGGTDAFLMKVTATTGAMSWWSYFGGPNNESARAVAIDSFNNVYVGGSVSIPVSGNPVTMPTVNARQASYGGGLSDGFVMATNTDGTARLTSTYLGGSGDDFVTALVVNPNDSVFVVGYTGSTDFPAVNNLRPGGGGTFEGFVTKYSYLLGSYLFSTYLGGDGTDQALGAAVDSAGIYVVGTTLSSDLGTRYLNNSTGLNNQDAFISRLTSNCTYAFSPNPVNFAGSGGTITVNVTTGSECGWTVKESETWLSTGSTYYGAGNGSFELTAVANSGTARSGSVTIAGITLPVNQATLCTYLLSGAGTTVGSGLSTSNSVTVTASGGSCTWTATSDSAWVSFATGSGTGSGAATFRVGINPLPTQRTATLTIGGQTYTVTQAGRARVPSSVGVYSSGAWRIDAARSFLQSGSLYFAWGTSGWIAVSGDWNGDGVSKVGVYNPTTGYWLLDMDNNRRFEPATDRYFHWGNSTNGNMIPVVGDWNGDGTSEVGVYQNGNWYLDLNGNRFLDAGESFAWGPTNGLPVMGDWNGSGTSKVGNYNPTTRAWILDSNGDRAYQFPTDFFFQWGAPGFTPLVGDFFGLGRDTVAAYSSGRFWLESGDGFANNADQNFSFIANSTGSPVVGDWNGSGTTKVGIVTTNQFTLDYDGNGILNLAADKQFTFGNVGETPVIGRWNFQ